jgi:hypothetical protein
MNPAEIIRQANEAGVTVALCRDGAIDIEGEEVAVIRWAPIIREHKPSIVAALKEAANDLVPEVFTFTPPGDLANDDEALLERAANMAKANGWNAATALREMRWEAHRERCWRAFLLNAKRVLDAPESHREGLLARYQIEAARRYGQAAGANMACGLRAWVTARGVH